MSNRVTCLGVFALSLITTGIMSSHAQAADLAEPYVGSQQFPEDRVEFGSGWYIRGDIGVAQGYGLGTTGTAPDVAPTLTFNRTHSLVYDASLGGGYQINNWIRTDVIADFHKPFATTASGSGIACPIGAVGQPFGGPFTKTAFQSTVCTPTNTGTLSSYDVLLNGYFDIGTWHGVTPYVGAGVGMSFGHFTTSAKYFTPNGVAYNFNYIDPVSSTPYNVNYDSRMSRTYYNLAFALMAGVAIDVYDHTKLDIGYRYLDLGRVQSTSMKYQEVRAGVRYMIDN